MRAAKTGQNLAKKRSLYVINEYFEQDFNEVFANVIVMKIYLFRRINRCLLTHLLHTAWPHQSFADKS
ncbi:MAG: hypothetical protein ACI8O8_001246 [Oleiphilaceae bacterium]|jgi:hypothetical protein